MFGEILVIGATLCWALGASLYKRGLLNVDPLIFNLLRSIPAAVYAFIMVYLLGKWELFFDASLVEEILTVFSDKVGFTWRPIDHRNIINIILWISIVVTGFETLTNLGKVSAYPGQVRRYQTKKRELGL